MYGVLRRYVNANALSDVMAARPQEVKDLFTDVPGFVAYYAVREGDGLTTLTVCQDKAGTDESTRRAGEWVRQNVGAGQVEAPMVTQGDVFVTVTSGK